MKTIVKHATAGILAFAACIEVNHASAQTLLGGYNPTGYGASATSNLPPTSVNANLTFGPLAKGSGITAVTTTSVFGGAGWTNAGIVGSEASSITHGLYITYTVAANPGYTISFTTNILYYHNSATGPWTGELQYSTDGVNYTDVAPVVYSTQPNPAGVAVTGAVTNNLSGVTALQNIPSTTMNYFRLVNWGAYGTTGTWYVEDNSPAGVPDLAVIGKITSPGIAPTITGITPSPITVGYGNTAAITVTATGDTPSYFWYKGALGSGTLIPTATTATLTLSNVTGANAGSYYVVLSNATPPTATSSVVTVSVIDPFITLPPNSAEGFLGGQAQFTVTAVGTSPSFSWYQSNASGNWTLIANGLQPSGSTVSGQGTTNLIISNVQFADSNNFANIEVLATGAFGTNASPPASLLNVSSNGSTMAQYVFNGVSEVSGVQDGLPYSGIIAQWNFNGSNFTNPQLNPPPYTGIYNPAAPAVFFPQPWIGVGSATAIGCVFAPVAGPSGISPYNGALSAAVDGMGYSPIQPNGSFGTENYPLTGSNKLNGVQFMTSTVGAKNITVSYYLRETGTSSEYTRLQYTTNSGIDWTDYPASSSFPGSDVNLYAPIYSYDLSGFPGVANNPEFGIQVVTEYQSTATYGIGSQGGNPLYITNGYVGADNLYSSGGLPTGAPTTSAGTLTFDLITIGGQPMNEAVLSPPTISAITNISPINGFNTITDDSVANGESNYDFVVITNTFTIGSAVSPVSNLVVSAQSLNPGTIEPGFSFTLSGSNVTMVITPNSIPDPLDAAPIVVTVLDTNSGDTTVEWFLLTLQSLNLPPTNSLTSVTATNMLANSTLNIPFYVGSYDGSNSLLTYSSNSLNNTVIPTANLALSNVTLTNLVFSITAGSNELGQGVVSATVYDNNSLEPRFTTATFPVMVRPNTNVILIDYFNYDNSGPLETVSYGYWSHLTGNENQVQVGNGPIPDSVTIDSVDFTETLQAPLLGAPYYTNSAGSNTAPVLYASYIITADALPIANGGYITAFNDGTGNAGGSVTRLECGLFLQTNGAAPNHYQVGIANFPVQEGAPGATWSQNLSVGTSYVIVTALTVSNGFSTLWVNPISQSSSSVQDTTTAAQAVATNVNILDFTLHEGTGGGVSPVSLSTLKIGTTFDSVFPSLHVKVVGTNAIVTWSDPTLSIQAAPDLLSPWVDLTGATTPYTNAIGTNTEMYFRFGH